MKKLFILSAIAILCLSVSANPGNPVKPSKATSVIDGKTKKDILGGKIDLATFRVDNVKPAVTVAKFGKWVWETECFYFGGEAETYHKNRITELKKTTLVDETASSVEFEANGCPECMAYCSYIKKWKP